MPYATSEQPGVAPVAGYAAPADFQGCALLLDFVTLQLHGINLLSVDVHHDWLLCDLIRLIEGGEATRQRPG